MGLETNQNLENPQTSKHSKLMWVLACVVIFTVFLVGAILIFQYRPKLTSPGTEIKTHGWNLYRNKNLGVTLKYPDKFLVRQTDYTAYKVTDIQGQVLLVALINVDPEDLKNQTYKSSQDFKLSVESQYLFYEGDQKKIYGENDLDEYYQYRVGRHKSSEAGWQFPPKKIIKMGNVRALDMSLPDMPDRRVILILKNGLLYILEYMPSQNEEVQAIASTLRIDDIALLPDEEFYSSPSDLSDWKRYPGRYDRANLGISFSYPPEMYDGLGGSAFDAIYEIKLGTRKRGFPYIYEIFLVKMDAKRIDEGCKFKKLDCSPFEKLQCNYISDSACVTYYSKDDKRLKDSKPINIHQWVKQAIVEKGNRRAYFLSNFYIDKTLVPTGKLTDDLILSLVGEKKIDYSNQKQFELFNATVKTIKFEDIEKDQIGPKYSSVRSIPEGSKGQEMTRRNEQRLSDVNKIATSLTMYYQDRGKYPDSLSELVPAYLSVIPVAPKAEQICSEAENTYTYIKLAPNDYQIGFCLEVPYLGGPYEAGVHLFTGDYRIK